MKATEAKLLEFLKKAASANGSPSEFLSSGLEMKIAPLLSRGHQHTGRPSLGNGEWLRMGKGRPGRNAWATFLTDH